MKCLESLLFVLIFYVQLSWSQWITVNSPTDFNSGSILDTYIGGWGNRIIFGYYDKTFKIFNTLTNTWILTSRHRSDPWRRVSTASANGFTYFYGGEFLTHQRWGGPSPLVDIYDHSTDTWSFEVAPERRSHGQSTGIDLVTAFSLPRNWSWEVCYICGREKF